MNNLLLLLLFIGCTRLPIASQGHVPIVWGARSGHDQFVSIEKTEDFYLWGLISPPTSIELNRELAKTGAVSVSKFSFEYVNDWDTWWPRLISFGFYWPQKWRAEAFVKKHSEEGFR